MRRYTILLVDDDPFILTGISKNLEMEGYRVITAANGEQALNLLEEAGFDLVITDLIMDKIDGIQVLKKAKAVDPESMVIILTGYESLSSAIDALRLNADDYLLKPCESEELHFRVTRCLEKLENARKIKFYEKILPVCCVCKKIRDDSGTSHGHGEWLPLERYLWKRAGVAPSSTYCPHCAKNMEQDLGQWK